MFDGNRRRVCRRRFEPSGFVRIGSQRWLRRVVSVASAQDDYCRREEQRSDEHEHDSPSLGEANAYDDSIVVASRYARTRFGRRRGGKFCRKRLRVGIRAALSGLRDQHMQHDADNRYYVCPSHSRNSNTIRLFTQNERRLASGVHAAKNKNARRSVVCGHCIAFAARWLLRGRTVRDIDASRADSLPAEFYSVVQAPISASDAQLPRLVPVNRIMRYWVSAGSSANNCA